MFNNIPLVQILGIWRAAATAPKGAARNALYWALVDALRSQGYAGDARRVLERAAPW